MLAFRDCRKVGYALIELGGGRAKIDDRIDPSVGILWRAQAGESVRAGQVIAEIHHRNHGVEECRALLEQSLLIGDEAPLTPLVLTELEG
jgi:thymidine phosphorylase